MGQEFGMTGKGKARAILQRLFVDGQRAQGQSLPALHQIHRAADYVDHALCIGRIG